MVLAMTDAIPLMETDGVTGRNNAHDIRLGLLTAMFHPDSAGQGVRQGVLPRRYTGTDYVDLKAIQFGSPGQGVQMYPGRCVISRTGQGPYLCTAEGTSTYNLDAADGSNPRYDLLYARLYDQAIGDSGAGPHGPRFEHINGTPAGSPVVPTLPSDGAAPIAAILRPAGNNNVTSANITDLRKATGLIGGVRTMLPGDALADVGNLVGEFRARATPSSLTALGAPPILVDQWGADALWHGTQDITIGPLTQAASGSLATGGNGVAVISVTIPDPGYSYRIVAGGSVGWAVIAATSPGNLFEGSVTVDSAVYNVGRLNGGYAVSDSLGAGFTQSTLHVPECRSDSTVYTGSHVVRLMARNTGITSFTLPASSVDTRMTVRLVPA